MSFCDLLLKRIKEHGELGNIDKISKLEDALY